MKKERGKDRGVLLYLPCDVLGSDGECAFVPASGAAELLAAAGDLEKLGEQAGDGRMILKQGQGFSAAIGGMLQESAMRKKHELVLGGGTFDPSKPCLMTKEEALELAFAETKRTPLAGGSARQSIETRAEDGRRCLVLRIRDGRYAVVPVASLRGACALPPEQEEDDGPRMRP